MQKTVIKLRYNYQKTNSLRDISYFMLKCAKTKYSRVSLILNFSYGEIRTECQNIMEYLHHNMSMLIAMYYITCASA